MTKKLLFLAFLTLLLSYSCKNKRGSDRTSLKAAVEDYYEKMFDDVRGTPSDIQIFLENRKDELLRTLDIEKVRKTDKKDVALVLVSFTIEDEEIHKGIWFHEVDGVWARVGVYSVEYAQQYIGYDEDDEELERMIELEKEWEEDNPKLWWAHYL